MAAIIHSDRRTADRRLAQYFNSTRAQWIEIVKAAVAARARCTDDAPKSAPGYFAWEAATTRTRQMFRREGWEKGSEDGIETIVHHELKKKIAVLNTDSGTAAKARTPMNRTPKGPAQQRVMDINDQFEMFKRGEMGPLAETPYSLWYLCIFDDGGKVRAEISRPSEFAGNYIQGFAERIFILEDDDWEKVLLATPADDEPKDIKITVRRKK
ncbi:MAG: hypothetical protein WB611_29115 [Stellaceae bacterium]